ncbi:MAG: lysophospholipid acyltransferase family protein [Gulosibacter sp.]|uniref:lysophospholipid acyltransferase family protein n=1 Tax=Gulosibacter sp. TaxID=2817531 RepID=UPI003F938B15
MTVLIRRLFAGFVRLITGARAVVAGGRGNSNDASTAESVLDLPQQMVLYANHSSHLDFVTIWSVVPKRIRDRLRPIAAGDYWGSGVKSWFATKIFNAYLVERGKGTGPRKASNQVEDMIAILDAGDSLLIFPEGTRGDGSEIGTFHSGLYRLASERPEVPIVPVALSNLGRMLPKGAIIPVPHLVTATFLDPIRVEEGESKREFLDRARDVVDRVVREAETA